MSNTSTEATEKKRTLWTIASYRRSLWLGIANGLAFMLTCAAVTNQGPYLGDLSPLCICAAVLLLAWPVFRRLISHHLPEPTNMLLVGSACYAAAILCADYGNAMLITLCGALLCFFSLGRIMPVMRDVIEFALPDKKKPAMLLLLGASFLSMAIGYTLYVLLLGWDALARFAAWLALAVLLISTLSSPVDQRYTHKLRRCLAQCPDNQPLRQRLEWVFVQPHSRPWLLLLLKAVVRPFYRYQRKDYENVREDEDNPLIYLCNHGINYGPVASVLHIPNHVRPWSISYIMVDLNEAADYLHRYSFGESNKLIPEPLKWPVSRWVARFGIWATNNLLESIPVFRDKPRQLMKTFRLSVDALISGDQMLIFPENPNAVCEDHGYEPEGLGELFSGFAMLAPIYYNRTGKRARFMPMYAHPKAHTLSFGHEVQFDPDNDPSDERQRLAKEIEAEMRRLMAREDALSKAKQ